MFLIFGITTYKRLDYLKCLIDSFVKYTDFNSNRWVLVIHNDCLNDETSDYIKRLAIDNVIIIHLESDRLGVHAATNKILNTASKFKFDYAFKADDDIFFIKNGWEKIYIESIREHGYEHLSYFNSQWNKSLQKKIYLGLKYHGSVLRCQGAFWTFTPNVLKQVGYFDVKNMGFRGIGHINYSYRCCKAGFNNMDNFYDIKDSEQYIQMHQDYKASLPQKEIIEHRKNQANKIKITKNSPIYIHMQ